MITGGASYRDPQVIHAVAITIAKISTQTRYLHMLEKNSLLGALLEKLLIMVEICSYSSRKRNESLDDSGKLDEELIEVKPINKVENIVKKQLPDVIQNYTQVVESLNIILDKENVAMVRECCCTAITRVGLCIGSNLESEMKLQLSSLFTEFLTDENSSVILNAITGIRSLGERGR